MSHRGEMTERAVELPLLLSERPRSLRELADYFQVSTKTIGVTVRIFAERTFHRAQRLIERTPRTAGKAETVTIEMRVASGRGLIRFILSWAPDVEVLSPERVRREVAEAHRRALAWYEEE